MKTKEIIEKLKLMIDIAESQFPEIEAVSLPIDQAKILLQALEEEPFLGCDTCETVTEETEGYPDLCTNRKSQLYSREVSKELSCIHHSRRKELTNEKCEHVTPICYNPDAFCYRSECDQADSCIHHSNRKEKK